MTNALSLEEARAAAERSLCSECGAPAPLRFESTAPDVSGVVRHVFIGRCPFCHGTLRVVFLVPVTNSLEVPPPAAGAPAESGKSWVVQHFEEAERLARESLATAMREAEAGGKERFDLERFERLLNRGPQARREKEHLNSYYIMRPECRTLQAYVNDLLAGEPWDQLAVAPTTHPATNELAYQLFKTSTDGDSIANVFVCADRIELDDSQLHTSPTHGAAAQSHTPTYRAVIRRGEPGWPDVALTWIRARFGDSVASEVHRVINEAAAFRE